MNNIKNISITIRGQIFTIKAEELNHKIWFHFNKKIFVLDKVLTKSSVPKFESLGNQNIILSPMPGQIIKVFVSVGSKVKENQNLLILSSMKMEYTLKSPRSGVVKIVNVEENKKVMADQILIEIL